MAKISEKTGLPAIPDDNSLYERGIADRKPCIRVAVVRSPRRDMQKFFFYFVRTR